MTRRLLPTAVAVFAMAGPGLAPNAHAGLEFCFEESPCDDGDPCTCDFEDPEQCVNDPRARWAAAGRATGLELELGGQTVIPPTPDSNAMNPDEIAEIPAAPLAHVELLHVEETETSDAVESFARAEVTMGDVKVLDQGGGNWLVGADSLRSVSESFADERTATSDTEGSTLENVVLNGMPLGDVSGSMDFTFQDPLASLRFDVRLLQKVRVGAAAGDPVPDPDAGVIVSGITVSPIRVTVRDMTDPENPVVQTEAIVASSDTRGDRFSGTTCVEQNPLVSGGGYVMNIRPPSGRGGRPGTTRSRGPSPSVWQAM